MQITSSLGPIDRPLEEAAIERPGEPLRIRLQPSLLRKPAGRESNTYLAWKNLHWMIEVADVPEGREFREALNAFFHVAAQQGIVTVHQALTKLLPVVE